jgi:hypothetical protein
VGPPTLCHTKSGRFTLGLREGLAFGDYALLADALPPVGAVTLAALCVSNVCGAAEQRPDGDPAENDGDDHGSHENDAPRAPRTCSGSPVGVARGLCPWEGPVREPGSGLSVPEAAAVPPWLSPAAASAAAAPAARAVVWSCACLCGVSCVCGDVIMIGRVGASASVWSSTLRSRVTSSKRLTLSSRA